MVPVIVPIFFKGFIPRNVAFNNKGNPQRIQVAFDASAPTTNCMSLKNLLLEGTNVQTLVSSIVFHDQLWGVSSAGLVLRK